MFQYYDFSAAKEHQPDDDQHGQQERQRELEDEAKEGRRRNFLLLGDSLDHEVRAVADVGERAKKNGPDTDGQDGMLLLREQLMDVAGARHAGKRAQETQ